MRAFFEVFAPAAHGHVVAAGHNSGLQPAALALLVGLGGFARGSLRSLPLYSLRCSGILMLGSVAATAAAETKRYADLE